MRILYLNYLYDVEGVSLGSTVKIRRLVQGLEALGHEVQDVWLNPHAAIRAGATAPHRRPFRHWLHRRLAAPKALLRNVQALPREQRALEDLCPDVLIMRLDLCRISAAWLAGRFGVPLVVDADAPVLEEQRRFLPEIRRSRWLAPMCERWVLRRSRRVFCPSSVGRELMIRSGADAERVEVVPNGADVLEPDEERRRETRRQLGISDGQPVIGFIGAFNRFHGIENLLAAFPEVSKRHPDARLLLVGGGGDHEPAVRRAAAGQPAILATGRVSPERVPELLRAMDLAVTPYSDQADFYFSPVKLFEYLAAGLVVVAPPLGQIAEVIDDGRNGLLYDAGRPEALAAALLDALARSKDDRLRLGTAARELVRSTYTWEHAARRLSRLLEAAYREGARDS